MGAKLTLDTLSASRVCRPCCTATAVSTRCVVPDNRLSMRTASAAVSGLASMLRPNATVVSEHNTGAVLKPRCFMRATAAASLSRVTRCTYTAGASRPCTTSSASASSAGSGSSNSKATPSCSSNWARRGLCEAR